MTGVRRLGACLSRLKQDDGRVVRITIPNNDSGSVGVAIEDAPEPMYEKGARLRHLRTSERGTVKSCDFNGPILVETDKGATELWGLDDVTWTD